MLKQNVCKIQKSCVCIRKFAKHNFRTEIKLKSTTAGLATSNVNNFYQDKNVLVTGATGFMGKCLVEKLLRSCPGIKNIYVLVRPKTGADCEKRIADLTNSQVFDRLKQEQPKAINKLFGLNGNIELPNLGLEDTDYEKLMENPSVVFHSAESINLQSFELKKITRTNLGGTKNVLDLCHKIPNCNNLIYLSSAITNYDLHFEVKDRVYPTKHSPEQVLKVLGLMKIQNSIQMLTGTMPIPEFNYENSKIFEMWEAMCEDDIQEFYFDLRKIHWPDYVEDMILGLKQYYLKEDLSSLPDARKNLQRKYKIYKFLQMTVITTALCSSMGFMHLFL